MHMRRVGVVGFCRMEKGELRGWKIPTCRSVPCSLETPAGLVCGSPDQRLPQVLSVKSELLRPPEAFRSITLHSRRQGQIKEKGTMNSFVGYFLWKGDDREEL